MKNKILIVEDEKPIAELLEYGLTKQGFETESCRLLSDARRIVKHDRPDLVLLDLSLPDGDGLDFCRRIAPRMNMPIIILTARASQSDKLLGLEFGADDYITKPFNILEVKARIKAIFRRMEPKKGTTENTGILESGDMKLDRDGKRAYIQGREIGLTAKEFEVLELLMLNPDKVYSRENLLKLVWGTDYPGDVRTVDVHIRRLREKIESNPSEPRYVHTKWGVGYYFNNK